MTCCNPQEKSLKDFSRPYEYPGMDHVLWIVLFLLASLLWAWILFWGGADWLESSFLSELILHFRAPLWSADGIRIFAGLTWLAQTSWFILGLFHPEARGFFW
jgi:hypothetical protein